MYIIIIIIIIIIYKYPHQKEGSHSQPVALTIIRLTNLSTNTRVAEDCSRLTTSKTESFFALQLLLATSTSTSESLVAFILVLVLLAST
jgi:hypothetical protein